MIRKKLKLTAVLLLIAAMATAVSGCGKEVKNLNVIPVDMPVPAYTNPLTGETDYSPSKLSKRPVAVVVENHPQARPQWAIDTPDMLAVMTPLQRKEWTTWTE